MSRNNQDDAFETNLMAILSRVSESVRFAETKNGALLTFASAWMAVIVTTLTGTEISLPHAITVGMMLALPFFALGALLAIISFLPRRRLRREAPDRMSLMFFGHIAAMSPAAYAAAVREAYLPKTGAGPTPQFLEDLSEQIVANSSIADRKFLLFDRGALSVLVALVTGASPPLPFVESEILAMIFRVTEAEFSLSERRTLFVFNNRAPRSR